MPSFNFSKLFNSITILFWIIVTDYVGAIYQRSYANILRSIPINYHCMESNCFINMF
ncbi:hypothetical protein AAZX31_19G237700 [Glycine max]